MSINRFSFHSFLPILALAFLLPLFSGCRKKVAVPNIVPAQNPAKLPADSAPPAITPDIPALSLPTPVEPAIMVPKVAAVPNSLELGEASFQAQDYANAIKHFDDYFKKHPKAANSDGALFRFSLSLAMDSSGKNVRRIGEVLKRLVAQFPGSPYRGLAEFILGLQLQAESLKEDVKEKEARIKLLSEELQKLKEIDLQRRPSRPSD
jgi:hypothetical protein